MQSAMPVQQTFKKPKCYFLVFTLNCVTSMDNVPSNLYNKVASNSFGFRCCRICSSDNFPAAATGPKIMYSANPGREAFEDKSLQCFFANNLSITTIFRIFKINPFFSSLDIISPSNQHYMIADLITLKVCFIMNLPRVQTTRKYQVS